MALNEINNFHYKCTSCGFKSIVEKVLCGKSRVKEEKAELDFNLPELPVAD